MTNPTEILEVALGELEAGRRVALAAVVATSGSTPQPVGALMCVDESARVLGTLGGGCVEAEVRRRAMTLLASASGGLLAFDLDQDYGYDDGMICGGRMDIAIQALCGEQDLRPVREALQTLRCGRDASLVLRPGAGTSDREPEEYRVHLEAPPRLIIVGAGHLGRILASFAGPLGFRVCVLDDRVEFANPRRFPPPIELVVGDIAGTLRTTPLDAGTYVVIVTRGHRHDAAALASVLGSPARYLGMIGSRRKIERVYDELRAAGATEESLARVHAPIGVHLGAMTTEEIALSIAAELVAVRRGVASRAVEAPPREAGSTL